MHGSRVVERLTALFRRRANETAPPPPPTSAGEHLELPASEDDVDMRRVVAVGADADGDPPAQNDVAGLTCIIDYVDASGSPSRRRITVRRLETKYDRTYLTAFCHERHALRSFRLDRVHSVTDTSHRTYTDPFQFFETIPHGRLPDASAVNSPDGQAEAFSRCRDGIRVLVFLARCDGEFHASERTVLSEYCRCRCDDPRYEPLEYRLEMLLEYADRQHPDAEVFLECARRIAGQAVTGGHLRLLCDSVRALVEADGAVTHNERRFVEEFVQMIEEM